MRGRLFLLAGFGGLLSLFTSVASASGVGAEIIFDGATGSLDGTTFTDQTVTITTVYDTSDITDEGNLGGDEVYQVQVVNDLATVNEGNIYDGIYVPFLGNPAGGVVEFDIDSEYISAGLNAYSLSDYQGLTNTGGLLSGYINEALPQDLPTGNGDLDLTSVSATYYQAFAVNVPEPASMGVAGLASGLLMVRRRQRQKQA